MRSELCAGDSALLDGNELLVHRANELRLRADQTIIRHLLEHVRAPSGHPRDGEGWGKHVTWQTDRRKYRRRVELDVRVEATVRFSLVEHRQGPFLGATRQLEEFGCTGLGCHSTQDFRARILGLVDAVSKTHEAVTAIERLGQPAIDVFSRTDRLQHVQHLRWRAAVERTLQRADRAGNRRTEIGAGGGDDAGGKGRCVHAVVSEEGQVDLEWPPVLFLWLSVEEL